MTMNPFARQCRTNSLAAIHPALISSRIMMMRMMRGRWAAKKVTKIIRAPGIWLAHDRVAQLGSIVGRRTHGLETSTGSLRAHTLARVALEVVPFMMQLWRGTTCLVVFPSLSVARPRIDPLAASPKIKTSTITISYSKIAAIYQWARKRRREQTRAMCTEGLHGAIWAATLVACLDRCKTTSSLTHFHSKSHQCWTRARRWVTHLCSEVTIGLQHPKEPCLARRAPICPTQPIEPQPTGWPSSHHWARRVIHAKSQAVSIQEAW